MNKKINLFCLLVIHTIYRVATIAVIDANQPQCRSEKMAPNKKLF